LKLRNCICMPKRVDNEASPPPPASATITSAISASSINIQTHYEQLGRSKSRRRFGPSPATFSLLFPPHPTTQTESISTTMSIAPVPAPSFRKHRLLEFQQQQQHNLLESVNQHKERVLEASLRVETLDHQIKEEMEKLFSLITTSSSRSTTDASTMSSLHHINNPNFQQLEAHILQLENNLLNEQRTLAECEQLYRASLERTKQRWKQQIEEHQRGFRVCYRAVLPQHSRTKSL
jgi:hypothetical protein